MRGVRSRTHSGPLCGAVERTFVALVPTVRYHPFAQGKPGDDANARVKMERLSSSHLMDGTAAEDAKLAQLLEPAVADWPLSHLRYLAVIASGVVLIFKASRSGVAKLKGF